MQPDIQPARKKNIHELSDDILDKIGELFISSNTTGLKNGLVLALTEVYNKRLCRIASPVGIINKLERCFLSLGETKLEIDLIVAIAYQIRKDPFLTLIRFFISNEERINDLDRYISDWAESIFRGVITGKIDMTDKASVFQCNLRRELNEKNLNVV